LVWILEFGILSWDLLALDLLALALALDLLVLDLLALALALDLGRGSFGFGSSSGFGYLALGLWLWIFGVGFLTWGLWFGVQAGAMGLEGRGGWTWRHTHLHNDANGNEPLLFIYEHVCCSYVGKDIGSYWLIASPSFVFAFRR
jgi:hypothetical protein